MLFFDPVFAPAALSALGGIAAGLGVGRLTGGNMTGGLLGGMIGAMAAHFFLSFFQYSTPDKLFLTALMALLHGTAGGAVLGLAGAIMMKKKT